jgi:hypothetical protein
MESRGVEENPAFLNRNRQHWDALLPRRREEGEESEEKIINPHASRPSLSSLPRDT